MLAIIENKWDIEFIKILPPQRKVLGKMLEEVFINKKFTECKTSRTLKIDVFEIPDNKKYWKIVLKCGLLFLNRANFCSDPSQILMLQFSTPVALLPPLPSLSRFTLANWNPLQHNTYHVLHRFPYFFLPHLTIRYHEYRIHQTICQAKSIKCIIKLYTDHNILCVKHATHQKAESSKLDNTVNNNSIFNTKYAGFSAKC